MTQLPIGESRPFRVDPRPLFVPSGLVVSPGERYAFAAKGRWKDLCKVCGPDGWKLWPLHLFNRLPGAAFFCLCGCVGDDLRNAFAIGAGRDWTVPTSAPTAKLQFFANDWASMYFNNHEVPDHEEGPLTVTITRRA